MYLVLRTVISTVDHNGSRAANAAAEPFAVTKVL